MLEITNVVGGVPGSITRVTVIIEDESAFGNDSSGSFSFERSEYRIAEGEKVEIPIDRLGGASGEAQLLIQIRGETATTGEDFYRAESDDLFDFNVGVRWADGEVLDNVTGRDKYMARLTKLWVEKTIIQKGRSPLPFGLPHPRREAGCFATACKGFPHICYQGLLAASRLRSSLTAFFDGKQFHRQNTPSECHAN